MAPTTRGILKDQLPRKEKISTERALNLFGAVASTVALLFVFVNVNDWSIDKKEIFALSYLFAIIVFLIIYLLFITQAKLYRYAQAVFHLHFVNHAVRDRLAAISGGYTVGNIDENLSQIIDSISACYSILTGRNCRVAIHEIRPVNGRPGEAEVVTVKVDNLTYAARAQSDPPNPKLDKNTEFKNVWYCLNGCSRYFHSADVMHDWKSHRYMSDRFDPDRPPEIRSFLGMSWVYGWSLPYRSMMVFPIRYIHNWQNRPIPSGPTAPAETPSDTKKPEVWGFLSVDSASRNAFRLPHAAEVGGAFADALYLLFTYSGSDTEAPNDRPGRII